MKYFVANWKAHKTSADVETWLTTFLEKIDSGHNSEVIREQATIIICPPFPFIQQVHEAVKTRKNIFVGAQDISMYEEGSDTGETTVKMIADQIKYTIIGHSERRLIVHETENTIAAKISLARKYNIEPILCIRDEHDQIHDAKIVAYEPVDAIGTGHNKSPQEVLEMRAKLALPQGPETKFLYGGSVNEHECSSYIQEKDIDGLLVGGASLDPDSFYSIVSQISSIA